MKMDFPQVDLPTEVLAWTNVTEDILNIYKQSCRLQACIVAICTEGSMKASINLLDYEIHPNACAFAISKAMVNSGVADSVAKFIIGLSDDYGPHVLLAMVFIITNLFTELITNNAAAALAFPLALSISAQLGVSPTPFFVVICMAASASFSTPIGYQTNLIVQGIGNYKFTDFVRIGLPLNIITFLISVILIPLIWNF